MSLCAYGAGLVHIVNTVSLNTFRVDFKNPGLVFINTVECVENGNDGLVEVVTFDLYTMIDDGVTATSKYSNLLRWDGWDPVCDDADRL